MINSRFLKTAFLISYLTSLIFGIFKLTHFFNDQLSYVILVVSTLIYILIGLYEIYVAKRPTLPEKAMWTIGFVVLSTVAGFIYLVNGRAKIQREYKILKR